MNDDARLQLYDIERRRRDAGCVGVPTPAHDALSPVVGELWSVFGFGVVCDRSASVQDVSLVEAVSQLLETPSKASGLASTTP